MPPFLLDIHRWSVGILELTLISWVTVLFTIVDLFLMADHFLNVLCAYI